MTSLLNAAAGWSWPAPRKTSRRVWRGGEEHDSKAALKKLDGLGSDDEQRGNDPAF
jgi:hypothetical protein